MGRFFLLIMVSFCFGCAESIERSLIKVEEIVFLPIESELGYARYSEGDVSALPDGRLAFLFSCFKGKKDNDYGDICISYFSDDEWSVPSVFIENHAQWNVMSPSLRIVNGDYKLFYLVKNSARDCQLVFVDLDDSLNILTEPYYLTDFGFNVVNNDRVFIDGERIIIPLSRHSELNGHIIPEGDIKLLESKDAGKNWVELDIPEPAGKILQEPGYLEVDGVRFLYARSDQGSQLIYDFDELVWEESEFISPLSPMVLEGFSFGLLGVFNDHGGSFSFERDLRNPLVLFYGNGFNSLKYVPLELNLNGFYSYPSILELNNSIFISYTYGDYTDGGWGAIKLIKMEWL